MIKKIILFSISILAMTYISAQSFVSPINFIENKENKNRVIEYIKYQVKKDYAAIGMDDPVTLRMMEEENLRAFKELIKVKNIPLLQRVIKTYCNIGMCNYSTILMMYIEQERANNQELKW